MTTSTKVPVSFNSSDNKTILKGTLESPTGIVKPDGYPVVLILQGSGSLDRDGNVPSGIMKSTLNIYNRLSDMLVRNGFATLRFDKRGIGESINTSNKDIFYQSGMYDLANDGYEALKFLQSYQDSSSDSNDDDDDDKKVKIDKSNIFICGHSEGGIVLPYLSKQAVSQPPKGYIMLCSFVLDTGMNDALKYQRKTLGQEVQGLTGFKGFILKSVVGSTEKIKAKAQVFEKKAKESNGDMEKSMFGLVKQPLKWWREHLLYNINTDYPLVTQHCLVISGGKDCQVDPAPCTMENVKSRMPNAASITPIVLPNLNHLLREQEGPISMVDLKQQYAKDSLVDLTLNWKLKL